MAEQTLEPGVATKFSEIRKALAGEAVLIFLMTCGAYLTVYTFEAGYCTYFRVPLAFIKLEVSSVLLFAATFWVFGWLLIQLGFLYPSIRRFLENRKNPVLRRALVNNAPLILFGFLLWIFTGNWGVLVGVCLVAGVFSILAFAGGGTPEERLKLWDEECARTGAYPFLAHRPLKPEPVE